MALPYHPFVKGRASWLRTPFLKWSFAGTDYYPALSEYVAKEINSIRGKNISEPIFWGPDLSYFPPLSSLGNTVIVSGRTGRDFLTFGKAASKTNIPSKIICLKRDYKNEFDSFGQNVEVVSNDKSMDYRQMADLYSEAKIIAIPYIYSKNLCGLTSLTDALAMGKPVLMTRSEFIDLDIEKEGIGIWVDSRDVSGWTKAIEKIYFDTQLAKQMGDKARKLAENGYNYTTFSSKMIEIIKKAVVKK
jgi:glycosyltransferase involved in cell wall biosynthesis